MRILGYNIEKIKEKEFKGVEIEVICDRCGFKTTTSGTSCGVDGNGGLYGHHFCADGEIGAFRG